MIHYIYTVQDKQPYITEFKALVVLECHTVLHNASYIQDNHFSSVLAEILQLKVKNFYVNDINNPLTSSDK